MGWVVNKQTFQFLENVNTPDYSPDQWLINPDMSVVRSFPTDVWTLTKDINGQDVIQLLTAEEQDTRIEFVKKAQDTKIDQLNTACAQTISSGFVSSALNGSPRIYDSTEVDQLNLIGSVTTTAPIPGFPDGSTIPYASRDAVSLTKSYDEHTYYQLRQVMADGAVFKLEQLQKFFSLKAQVQALTRVSDINLVSW